MDKDGYLAQVRAAQGHGRPQQQSRARGVRLLNMQQLYNPDTAAMLVPAYLDPAGVRNAEVVDMRPRAVTLDGVAELDWTTKLHLLCLSAQMDYNQLWCR